MTTAPKRIIRETEHVRNAERFLGGRLEDTLKPYLNERGTMSDLASAIGVQKATVNYWIMRLGIKYERVAYDESEEVRVYTREEAELADAAIDSGLDADELERMDRTTYDAFTEFRRNERAGTVQNDLSARDVKLLESIKQAGEDIQYAAADANFPGCLQVAVELLERGIRPEDLQSVMLTRSDVQAIARVKGLGIDLHYLNSLDEHAIGHLRDFEKKGLRLNEFADIDRPQLRALNRLENAGLELEKVEDLTPDDLDLLDSVRQAGWDNETKMKADLDLLAKVKSVDPTKLESAINLFSP